jgi:vacuolar-type H+-ATPase subunit H
MRKSDKMLAKIPKLTYNRSMPNLPVQLISLGANVLVILFILTYFLRSGKKEKNLQTKQLQQDNEYHQVIDDAMSKEREIISDAKSEAETIIHDAKIETQQAQETIDQALAGLTDKIEQSSIDESAQMLNDYSETLKKLTATTLTDFANITRGLEGDMQKQVTEFRNTLLPNLEKELETYKALRIKQSEETISQIVKKVAQEVLNKSLSMEDHQKLVLDALDKAKAEGVFS